MKVDKITKDLIGREAKVGEDWFEIRAVAEFYWWGKQSGHDNYNTFDIEKKNCSYWIIKDLPEPRKKPSERILEIFKVTRAGEVTVFDVLDTIAQYLDEREEKYDNK